MTKISFLLFESYYLMLTRLKDYVASPCRFWRWAVQTQ